MSTKHLLALLNSHIEGDDEQFLSITLQIAAQEARQGRIEEADKLKRLVQRRAIGNEPADRPAGRHRSRWRGRGANSRVLVESAFPKITLASMVLADDVRRQWAVGWDEQRSAWRFSEL